MWRDQEEGAPDWGWPDWGEEKVAEAREGCTGTGSWEVVFRWVQHRNSEKARTAQVKLAKGAARVRLEVHHQVLTRWGVTSCLELSIRRFSSWHTAPTIAARSVSLIGVIDRFNNLSKGN